MEHIEDNRIRSTLRLTTKEQEELERLMEVYRIGRNKNDAIAFLILNFGKKMEDIKNMETINRDLKHSLRKAESIIHGAKSIFKEMFDYGTKKQE